MRSLLQAALALLVALPARAQSARQTAVLAGGCFWGVEYLFEHVNGVIDVKSGYSDHAESVHITFDPAVVSYETLLRVFFSVAHDPTQLNRQGPDTGMQYRSAVFYADDEQQRVARAYIERLRESTELSRPIVTEVTPLERFYEAERYHQDYVAHHPHQPYVVFHDLPKVGHLRARFPGLYRERTTGPVGR